MHLNQDSYREEQGQARLPNPETPELPDSMDVECLSRKNNTQL